MKNQKRVKRAAWLTSILGAIMLNNAGASASSASNWVPAQGTELIGTEAPEFKNLEWLNHEPLSIKRMHGKALLIRFWLAGCPLCENSAQALNHLYEKYGGEGLMVPQRLF